MGKHHYSHITGGESVAKGSDQAHVDTAKTVADSGIEPRFVNSQSSFQHTQRAQSLDGM